MVNNKFLPFKDSCESVLLSKQMHPQPNAPFRTLFLGAMAMAWQHEHLGGKLSKLVPIHTAPLSSENKLEYFCRNHPKTVFLFLWLHQVLLQFVDNKMVMVACISYFVQ